MSSYRHRSHRRYRIFAHRTRRVKDRSEPATHARRSCSVLPPTVSWHRTRLAQFLRHLELTSLNGDPKCLDFLSNLGRDQPLVFFIIDVIDVVVSSRL